jgi:hypothetical protein
MAVAFKSTDGRNSVESSGKAFSNTEGPVFVAMTDKVTARDVSDTFSSRGAGMVSGIRRFRLPAFEVCETNELPKPYPFTQAFAAVTEDKLACRRPIHSETERNMPMLCERAHKRRTDLSEDKAPQ